MHLAFPTRPVACRRLQGCSRIFTYGTRTAWNYGRIVLPRSRISALGGLFGTNVPQVPERGPVGSEFVRRVDLRLYPDASEIDETEPERAPWHHKLARLARSGKFNKAMSTLEDMMFEGFYPGPAACHALILAHATAEDPEGAVAALGLMERAGLEPYMETYALVIQLCVLHGRDADAEEVFASLPIESSVVPWITYCHALLSLDRTAERGYQQLCEGEAVGLEAPANLQEDALLYLCRSGLREELARRCELLSSKRIAIQRHIWTIVQATRRGYRKVYKELPQHAVERRQIAFYIALIKETLESEPTPKLTILCGDIDEDMSRQSVPLNREYLSLQVQVGLRADNEEYAKRFMKQLMEMDTPVLPYLETADIMEYMEMLCDQREVYGLIDLLNAMHNEGRQLQVEDLEVDADGRTLFTSWLPDVSGVRIRRGGVIFDADARQVVDENGVPVPIEEMTTKQLRAELQLRKHPISGNKADLYRRLELARTGKRPAPRGKAAQAAPSPVNLVQVHEAWKGDRLLQSVPKMLRIWVDEDGIEIKPRKKLKKGEPDPDEPRIKALEERMKLAAYDERMDYVNLIASSTLSRVPRTWKLSRSAISVMKALLTVNIAMVVCPTYDFKGDRDHLRALVRMFPRKDRVHLLRTLRAIENPDTGERTSEQVMRAMNAGR